VSPLASLQQLPTSAGAKHALIISRDRPHGAEYLYVANSTSSNSSSGDGSVTVYRISGRDHLVRTIGGLLDARAIAFDPGGDMYVLSSSGGSSISKSSGTSVEVFAAGTGTKIRTITAGITSPLAIAVDSQGVLYVANGLSGSSSTGSVTEYRPKGGRVMRTIKHGIWYPLAMQFDGSGNLYVLSAGASHSNSSKTSGTVSVYAPRKIDPKLTLTNGIRVPTALAVDSAGDVFVANGPFGSSSSGSSLSFGSVVEFPAGSSPSSPTSATTITKGVSAPVALALDGVGDLYVANSGSSSSFGSSIGSVTVYRSGGRRPWHTITNGVHYPAALLATATSLFVANGAGGSSSSSSSSSSEKASVAQYSLGGIHARVRITNHVSSPQALGFASH
jgi:hypothetical protein